MRKVIHEIKNHLAVAVANCEAFRDGLLEPSTARLNAVLQALAEADVLLGELPGTELPPTLPASTDAMDVCAVITGEVLGLEAAARRKGIAFDVHQCARTGAACREFHGDPVRIAEIVNNVVSNAIRYTPYGGRVEVDCRRADGTLVLGVSDSGPGIGAGDRTHIFEAGYRGSAAGGSTGSGLGLSLAKRFAEEHGGSIDVLGVSGAGAQFVVKLPGVATVTPLHADTGGVISLL
jgi:signal transduction histidine kinase